MRILTRYLVRVHVAPFLFSFSILTGLLFLNAVAQRLQGLVGKGLGWEVVAEFFLLSLPHTVALTFPMSVLVAVLYAFSELTASNEVTAMAAGGVNPARLLVPLVGVGALLAGSMLYFNDRVLPEANHRLKNLMVDIGRKSPTFELREQVVNEIRTTDARSRYFLQARDVDPATNEMERVVIYDVSSPTAYRTIYADRGAMAFNEQRTDLFLTLYDGVIYEASRERPGGFQQLYFRQQIIPMRGVSDMLERQMDATFRSDREMSIAMLAETVRERREELERVREESQTRSRYAVERALGITDTESGSAPGPVASLPAPTPSPVRPAQAASQELPPDGVTQGVAMNMRTNAARALALELSVYKHQVEIHKKWTIAFACIVFVLLGAPLAVRFPRGGVGMVIAVSVSIFAIYWMCLIGGEKLADKGHVAPFWAMWTPNFVFAAIGLALVRRMGRDIATARGGGWDDLVYTLRRALARPFTRRAAAAPG